METVTPQSAELDRRIEAGARALAAASFAGSVDFDKAWADEEMRAVWMHTAAHVLIAADKANGRWCLCAVYINDRPEATHFGPFTPDEYLAFREWYEGVKDPRWQTRYEVVNIMRTATESFHNWES